MRTFLLILIATLSSPSFAMDYEDARVVISAKEMTESITGSELFETLPNSTKQLVLDVEGLLSQIDIPSGDEQLTALKERLQKIQLEQLESNQ